MTAGPDAPSPSQPDPDHDPDDDARLDPDGSDGPAVPAGLADGRSGDREPEPGGRGSDARGDEPQMGVSGTQVAASVLASVSAAVVASFFGVAGTIVGAAVVSVVATIGSAAYSLGIRRTKSRLQQLQALQQLQVLRSTRPSRPVDTAGATPVRPAGAGAGATDDTAELVAAGTAAGDPADPTLAAAQPSAGPSWRDWLVQRRWGVAASVVIVFVLSMTVVTLIEVVGDRPLSGRGDSAARTSVGALLPGDGSDDGPDDGGEPGGETDPAGPGTTQPGAPPTTTAPDARGGEGDTSPTTVEDGSDDTPASTTPTTSTSSTPTTAPPPTTATTAPAPTTTVPVPTTAGAAPAAPAP